MKRSEVKTGKRLADTVLDNLEPEIKEYRINDGEGLYFVVNPSGRKRWELRYKKPDGKWSFVGLGAYPAVKGKLARAKALELTNAIANGDSPIITKQAKKQQELEVSNSTLEQLVYEYLSNGKPLNWTENTMKRSRGALEKHILPVFGKRDYRTIKPLEWLNLFEKIQQEQGIIEQVNRMCSLIRSAYRRAKVTGRIEYNPLEGLGEELEKVESESMPHVQLNELPALLRAIRNYPTRNISIGLQLLSMLFPRPSELAEATKDEFDFERREWTIPAQRMKRRIEFAIPLTEQAVGLLKELFVLSGDSPYLFPSRTNPNQPISNNTFNMALKRLGYKNRQVPHGFRHIASTLWNKRYSDRAQVVEAALSHLKKGVKGKYDKEAHLEERVSMQQWWCDYLDQLADDSVIQFKTA